LVAYSHNIVQFIAKINAFAQKRCPFFMLVDFEMNKPLLLPLDEIDPSRLLIDFGHYSNCSNIAVPLNLTNIRLNPQAPEREKYSAAFEKIMYHLNRGDTYLLNLTFPVKIDVDMPLYQLFHIAKARYKIYMKDHFLVFSPETFIRIQDSIISTYPMKGTIDANLPGAETLLLDNEKELAEHYTITDLLRNDLSMVATQVRVKQFRYIDHIRTNNKHLLQTSSEISGILSENWESSLGNIIFTMLPAGSVSGAPKKRTCEIIKEAEGGDRRYYTGIAGIYDGNSFDSCVLIRYIEQQGLSYYYRAGGGITTQSSCESEYQELMDKIYVPFI
jgi:para-aminobenzoate synthetase component I